MRPARDHCLAPARTAEVPTGGGRYTRLLPDLPALAIGAELVRADLLAPA